MTSSPPTARRCWRDARPCVAVRPYLLLLVLTLPVTANLLRRGFWMSGDGLHHLHRVAALTHYLADGVLFPRWIGEFSFGYGAPVFNFYSPLAYYLAQLFTLPGPVWALKLVMLTGLVVSAAFLYRFAAPHVGQGPALTAALVYACAPYRFVDLYPRAALAEHSAFLWLPLILWAYDGVWSDRRRGWQVLSWAGLVLTHSFTALMFAPFFALYLGWSAWRHRRWRPLLGAGARLGLAVGLTAFFWLPLLREARYAGLGSGEVTYGYRNHLTSLANLIGPLIYDYSTGGGRPDYYFAFGAVATAILFVALMLVVVRQRRFLPAFGVVTCLAALFLVSRPSEPLWDALAPILAPIQFPWRFLGLSTFGLALGSAGIIQSLPANRWRLLAAGGMTLALLGSSLARLPFEPLPLTAAAITPEQLWAFDRDTGQAGTTWGGEFLPVGITEQRWALGRAVAAPVAGPPIAAPTVRILQRAGDDVTLTVSSRVAWTLRMHTFYFPGWQVSVDGRPTPTGATGDLGLLTADLPAGEHAVAVRFELTATRRVARWISGLALAFLPLAAWWPLHGRRRWSGGGLALLILLITVGGALRWPVRGVTPTPLQATFGDQARLIACQAAPQARPGEQLTVVLGWLALRQVDRNDKSFVHLVNAEGQVVSQHDGDPGGGFTPTTRWQPGELIWDRHYLALPPDLPPGRYWLKAGLYQYEPLRNLLTDPPTGDGRVDLGEVLIQRDP